MQKNAKHQRGFTLIELMITVVIIGILAAIAVPSYQGSVRKGHRGDAQAFMLDVAQKEQQYFTDSRSYTNSLTTLGDTPQSSVSSYYSVTVQVPNPNSTATAPTFLITATPTASSQVPDGTLTLDNTGVKTPAGYW